MKKIFHTLIILFTVTIFLGCEEDDTDYDIANLVSFEASNLPLGVELGSQTTQQIAVYTSTIVGDNRTFNISVNTDLTSADVDSYTVDQSVTVPANTNVGTFDVSVSDINIGSGVNLVLSLDDAPDIYEGDDITLEIEQSCPNNQSKASIEIIFDDYASETVWAIYDANDTSAPLFSDSGFSNGDVEYSNSLCLEPGDYLFVMFDAYGDGICCSYGEGSYEFSINNALVTSGGEFGSQEVTPFTVE